MTTQLDLFGEVVTAERQRQVDALTCLREAMPDALELVVELRNPGTTDTRDPRAGGDWAYCVSNKGLRFERTSEWWGAAHDRGETWGWNRTPRNLITWAELGGLIGDDPRRAEIAAWAASLPDPRWKQLMRPHELWTDPDGWHVSYYCHDHLDAHWTGRRRAWQLVLDLLGDAMAGQ